MRKGKNRARRENLKNGLLFTSPAIIGLLCLTAYPVLASLFYSFCNYSALKPPQWAGLANYKHMMHDALLLQSMVNTAVYAIFSVPI